MGAVGSEKKDGNKLRLIHFSQALPANKESRALIHSLVLDRHDPVSVQTAENEIEVE